MEPDTNALPLIRYEAPQLLIPLCTRPQHERVWGGGGLLWHLFYMELGLRGLHAHSISWGWSHAHLVLVLPVSSHSCRVLDVTPITV